MMITMFAEGTSFNSESGPNGSWKITVVEAGAARVYNGSGWRTTKPRMELMALINGFNSVTVPNGITVCIDSEYVKKAIGMDGQGWLREAVRTDQWPAPWAPDKDLWMRLVHAMQKACKDKAIFVFDRKEMELMKIKCHNVAPDKPGVPVEHEAPVVNPIHVVKQMSDEDLCAAIGLERFGQIITRLTEAQKKAVRAWAKASPRKAKVTA